jgi:formate dehydrogenase iron-sulfur subunit
MERVSNAFIARRKTIQSVHGLTSVQWHYDCTPSTRVKPNAPHSLSGNATGDGLTLIDDLLGEQQSLTAVERFARAHDRNELPALEKHYRRLLPAAAPKSGQQYAFEVDLDKCSGCKACVTACHSLNGLDENETWRSVGLLVNDPVPRPANRQSYQQHVTTACHHCVDPGCLTGCPVLAYDKDPLTGIVRHLDDQCIGCQYCVLKCPYEVPRYSKERGIVRKCDMCANRLAVGEAPACVQACPHEAIKITVVDQAKVRGKYRALPNLSPEKETRRKGEKGSKASGIFSFSHLPLFTSANSFLPVSPNPAITLPTTRFISARPLPDNLFAGDDMAVRPSDSHLPLVFLLVFSQLAVGASVAGVFVKSQALLLAAVIAGMIGLGVGTLHLGQPLKAWRAFLGWRTSWFSREVIVFGGYVPAAATAAASLWFNVPAALTVALSTAAAFVGLLGVFCSTMIYVDTRREFWSASQSGTKFFGTVLLLGAASAWVFAGATMFVPFVIIAAVGKLAFEQSIFRRLLDHDTLGQQPLNKTALLLAGELGLWSRSRLLCGFVGGVLLPALYLLSPNPAIPIGAFAMCIIGELLERCLYFTAVVTRKMPGAIAS